MGKGALPTQPTGGLVIEEGVEQIFELIHKDIKYLKMHNVYPLFFLLVTVL